MDTASSLPEPPEPAPIRRLRLMVSALLGVMIVGLCIIVGLMAWRILATPAPPVLPATLSLPPGHSLAEASVGGQWITLIAQDEMGGVWVHVADRAGVIRASTQVQAP
ncbi:MAG: DUF6476 family protein [Pseudomonadota bacterium]